MPNHPFAIGPYPVALLRDALHSWKGANVFPGFTAPLAAALRGRDAGRVTVELATPRCAELLAEILARRQEAMPPRNRRGGWNRARERVGAG